MKKGIVFGYDVHHHLYVSRLLRLSAHVDFFSFSPYYFEVCAWYLYARSGHSTKCSVRATNVYEERTLGLYKEDGEPEYSFDATGSNRVKIWGRYLAMHARKQLAFGSFRSHC